MREVATPQSPRIDAHGNCSLHFLDRLLTSLPLYTNTKFVTLDIKTDHKAILALTSSIIINLNKSKFKKTFKIRTLDQHANLQDYLQDYSIFNLQDYSIYSTKSIRKTPGNNLTSKSLDTWTHSLRKEQLPSPSVTHHTQPQQLNICYVKRIIYCEKSPLTIKALTLVKVLNLFGIRLNLLRTMIMKTTILQTSLLKTSTSIPHLPPLIKTTPLSNYSD